MGLHRNISLEGERDTTMIGETRKNGDARGADGQIDSDEFIYIRAISGVEACRCGRIDLRLNDRYMQISPVNFIV